MIALVVVGSTNFVSTCGTMVPRTMAAATDEAIMPISAAKKRWDNMTPLVWSNKNKNKNKRKNKNKNKHKHKHKNKHKSKHKNKN